MLGNFRWAAATLLIGWCMPSYAATQYYINDEAGWLAATSLTSTITFDSAEPGYTPPAVGSATNVSSAGLSVNGFVIHNLINGVSSWFEIVNPSAAQWWYDWGSGASVRAQHNTSANENSLRITLPAGITSFGLNLMSNEGTGPATFQVRVNGTLISDTVPTFARPTRGFFGITSETDVNTVEFIAPPSVYGMLDNLSYGVVSIGQQPPPAEGEIPEASTLVLCASALLCFSRLRRPLFS